MGSIYNLLEAILMRKYIFITFLLSRIHCFFLNIQIIYYQFYIILVGLGAGFGQNIVAINM